MGREIIKCEEIDALYSGLDSSIMCTCVRLSVRLTLSFCSVPRPFFIPSALSLFLLSFLLFYECYKVRSVAIIPRALLSNLTK